MTVNACVRWAGLPRPIYLATVATFQPIGTHSPALKPVETGPGCRAHHVAEFAALWDAACPALLRRANFILAKYVRQT